MAFLSDFNRGQRESVDFLVSVDDVAYFYLTFIVTTLLQDKKAVQKKKNTNFFYHVFFLLICQKCIFFFFMLTNGADESHWFSILAISILSLGFIVILLFTQLCSFIDH